MTLHDRGAMLTGMGLGAGLMYFLDPDRGRRRRALLRDQLAHSAHLTVDAAGTTGRDLAHRATGTAARLRPWGRGPADDDVLAARVRAQLGRLVSHPHAIQVDAADGRITLRGPVLQAESARLLKAVAKVRGVREVVNALDEHRHAENVPALQGGTTPRPPRADLWQRQWAPTTRLMVGTSGTALAGYGLAARNVPGAMLALAGFGLIARAATNVQGSRLLGIGAGRRAVDIQKTITVNAPVEDVFKFWTSYQNFPRFMSRVLEVRPSMREGQSHWVVAGPAGMPVQFDAEVTRLVENKVFGWRTVEGSPIAHAGLVHFDPAGEGRTRIHIQMSYNPPGGWLGHGIAAAFGVDPKHSMDADLVRLKTLLETGKPARDAAARM